MDNQHNVPHFINEMRSSILTAQEHLRTRDKNAKEEDAFALVHLGAEHEAIPTYIFRDPILKDTDRNMFGVLKTMMPKQSARGGMTYPTYNELMKAGNIGSRATVSRALAVLRLTRWITASRVNGSFNENMNNIYMTHDQPLSFSDVNNLSDEYIDYINDCKKHPHEYVRRVATLFDEQINKKVYQGIDITEQINHMDTVLISNQYIVGKSDKYFELDRELIELHLGKKTRKLSTEQSTELSTGGLLPESVLGKIPSVLPFSESVPPTLEGSTESVLPPNTPVQNLYWGKNRPSTESVLPEKPPSTESVLPIPMRSTDSVLLSSSCSSSYSINTTTTKDLKQYTVEISNEVKKLVSARFAHKSGNIQELLGRHAMRLPEKDRIPMVYEISNRERDQNEPVRSVVGLMVSLIKKRMNGDLVFTDYAEPDWGTDKRSTSPIDEKQKRLSGLLAEITEKSNDLTKFKEHYQITPSEFNDKQVQKGIKQIQLLYQERQSLENELMQLGILEQK